jgi:tetratricopeptide (TPR) repeat protein
MISSRFAVVPASFAWALASALLFAAPSLGDIDGPAPKIDCSKRVNKNKPPCKPSHGDLSDDEVYNAAYWLAHAERYAEALAVLARAKNGDDARILNITGFATRKLGDIEGALAFYRRALALRPDYALAREYMGEALLAKGDVAAARAELGEIENRCGKQCVAYADLAKQIMAFEAAHRGS